MIRKAEKKDASRLAEIFELYIDAFFSRTRYRKYSNQRLN